MVKINIIFLFIFSFNIISISSTQRHLVKDLFNGLYDKEIYSGYLKTDIKGTELFYIFTPSQSSPKKDPIILWLTGGPSCSSIYNLFEDIGPLIFIPNKKEPIINEYAWNKNANIFYIDSPGGVGFSKLKNKDFNYNDDNQAVSLNIAIQNFFEIFNEYQKHPFYIAGVSYAGTYIPHLVTKMFKYMEDNPDAIKINLKGFLIGNPYTNQNTDYEDSIIEFCYSHALINTESFQKYLKECPHWPKVEKILKSYNESKDYEFDPIINKDLNSPLKNVTRACNEVRKDIKKQLEGINAYGILNSCIKSNTISELKKGYNNINYDDINLYSQQIIFKNMINKNINKKYEMTDDYEYEVDILPSCGYNKYTPDFLNNSTTKKKLGVDESMICSMCSNLDYKMGDSMFYYKKDIKELSSKKNFSSWLYSGTEDIIVTPLATLRTLKYLNYTIKEKWKRWKVDGQVVGMEQIYEYGLRFITVKNAGHMVVEDNPKIAKALLDKFIEFNQVDDEIKIIELFPVWIIIPIFISCLLIIIIFVVILALKKKRKDLNIEVEEKDNLIEE